AIGRWRIEEVVSDGQGANPKVDASGHFADGRKFADVAEFKKLLVADLDAFGAAFVEKLAIYALRRPMTIDDRPHLARIAAQAKRIRVHPQRRQRADLADHPGGPPISASRPDASARKAQGQHYADQRPASSQRHRLAAHVRNDLAHRRAQPAGFRELSQ